MVYYIIIGLIVFCAVGLYALNEAVNEMEVWRNEDDE